MSHTTTGRPATAAAPPEGARPPVDREAITRLVCGHMETRAIGAMASLGIADRLGDETRPAGELAHELSCEPGALHRLLRALTALGLVAEVRPAHFALTEQGALLRTDRPDSLHSFVRMCTDPAMLEGWRGLEGAVRDGRPAFDDVFGTDFFTHLAREPELNDLFNAAMRQNTGVAARILPTAYDFGRFATLADVGGGDGTLLSAVLRAHPGLRGLLYDTAEGLAQSGATFAAAGVADRCTTATGDFFTSVPAGADAYLLKSVLHDWDDVRSERILGHCREVVPPHGRLLIVEPVLPDVVDASASPLPHLSDLNMLVNLGGRERTRADFVALCARTGFELADVTPLAPARYALVEAVPV
ncbi:methyltransferase [Streptomyces sp. NPDC047315]|uniref:methyltransferase n=1 Tax=Streptomyces sp. NPDC047315 TaxID=3155142 RepID=UPI0033E3A0B9